MVRWPCIFQLRFRSLVSSYSWSHSRSQASFVPDTLLTFPNWPLLSWWSSAWPSVPLVPIGLAFPLFLSLAFRSCWFPLAFLLAISSLLCGCPLVMTTLNFLVFCHSLTCFCLRCLQWDNKPSSTKYDRCKLKLRPSLTKPSLGYNVQI